MDINYVFESTCSLWALCCFNFMPCVISRWSPDLVSIVFVTTESDLDQCLFTLDDAFFPTAHEGKRFLDCVWVRLLKDHMQKRSHLMCSPYYLWGGETKPWGYRWGYYPWDQETTYQRGQYHANCEWVDPVRDIFLCNRHILWQNAFYLYLGKSK